MKYPPKPFKNSYWLVPDLILAGEVPVGGDESITQYKIESLLDVGIRVFINLLSDEPFDYQQILKETADARKIQYEYIHFPIIDMSIPERSVMTRIMDTLAKKVDARESVYYHCYAGLGRTGIVSCCWLAQQEKLTGNKIFKRLNKIRKEQDHMKYWESPQSQIQYDFVLSWKT